MAIGSLLVGERVQVSEGQEEWRRAGDLLAERDPRCFRRLLAIACAFASLHEEQLESSALFEVRMREICVARTKTSQ